MGMKKNIKEHIINTAGELFYTKGFNRTGINQIIDACDIAKATLYHHFKSKDAICIAYLKHKHDSFMQGLSEFVKEKQESKQQLLAIFDYLRELYRTGELKGDWGQKIMSEITPKDTEIWNTVQQQKKELLFFLGEIVGRTVAHVSKAEVEKISGTIYLLYESAITETYIHENDWPIHLARTMAPVALQDVKLL